MVAAGSRGRTLEQLLEFLGSKSVTDLNTMSSRMMTLAASNEGSSKNSKQGPIMSFVNRVWVDHRFPLKPSFQGIAKGVYKAEANTVDFVTQGEQVRNQVNLWAENATKGLIKGLLPSGCFNSDTVLVLANALYFKGSWLRIFDASRTRYEDFHLLNGGTIQVPFITSERNEEHYYGYFEDFKLLKIPYQYGQDNERFSMNVFLPDERDGLQKLMQKFNSDPGLLNKHLELQKVKLSKMWIPKLKFSYGFQASNIMEELGLILPFRQIGELTEMVDSPENDKVFVSNIFHKSCIEVNEEGTEAAACTSVKSYGCSRHRPPIPSFIANHPFMFMVREDVSGIVFFTGAVLDPLSTA